MDFPPTEVSTEVVLYRAKQEVTRRKKIYAINMSEIWPKYTFNSFQMSPLELSFLDR